MSDPYAVVLGAAIGAGAGLCGAFLQSRWQVARDAEAARQTRLDDERSRLKLLLAPLMAIAVKLERAMDNDDPELANAMLRDATAAYDTIAGNLMLEISLNQVQSAYLDLLRMLAAYSEGLQEAASNPSAGPVPPLEVRRMDLRSQLEGFIGVARNRVHREIDVYAKPQGPPAPTAG